MSTKKSTKKKFVSRFLRPQALFTVEQLRQVLNEYPGDMQVKCGSEDGVVLVVFNENTDTEHLSIEENDGCWADELGDDNEHEDL